MIDGADTLWDITRMLGQRVWHRGGFISASPELFVFSIVFCSPSEKKKKKKKHPQQLPSALSQCGCDYRLTFSNVFSITMSLLRFCQVSAADLSWFTGIAGRLKSWLPYGRLRGCWGVWSAFVQMLRPAVIKQMCGRWPWLSTSCQ